MKNKIKKVKKEEKIDPMKIIIVKDISKAMSLNSSLMDDLVEEIVHQMNS
jgi:hypothetical protein